MRKAMMFFAAALVGSGCPSIHASRARQPVVEVALAHVPGSPFMALPGTRPALLAPAAAWDTVPQPVISEVTNYPNPFDSRKSGTQGQTQIAYRLLNDWPVTVTIYDLLGLRVRRWSFSAGQNGAKAGLNTFPWDGTNDEGQKVAKGGYVAQIEVITPQTTATALRKIGLIH